MSVEKKRQMIKRRKERLESKLNEMGIDKKAEALEKWNAQLETDRFNIHEVRKISERYKEDPNHKMVKGDNTFLDTIFVANNLYPQKILEVL